MEKARLVRRYLSEKGQLVMPGVFDALSAKIAARAGFEVIFITGYSVSAPAIVFPPRYWVNPILVCLLKLKSSTRPNGFVPLSIHP
jgi:hypothetical protein